MDPGSFTDTVKWFHIRGMTHAKAQNRVSWSDLKEMEEQCGRTAQDKVKNSVGPDRGGSLESERRSFGDEIGSNAEWCSKGSS